MKKRVNNDIVINWTILRNEVAEDFSDAINIKLVARIVNSKDIDITQYSSRENNVFYLRIPAGQLNIGTYTLILTYQKPDATIVGGFASHGLDIKNAFEVVRNSEQEDDEGRDITSDAHYAVDGATFIPAITEVEGDISLSWTNNRALPNPDSVILNEGVPEAVLAANNAATLANQKAGLAQEAADNANAKAGIANTAAQTANNAAALANEKAGYALAQGDFAKTQGELAQTARENIEGDLGLKLDKTSITNELGDSEELVVSQKGVKSEVQKLQLTDTQQSHSIKQIEDTLNSININQEATAEAEGYSTVSLPKNAANGGMSVKLEGLTEEVEGESLSFLPTGRVRSVDSTGLNPTSLYLQSPVLRSNGTVKDEIRKGANGYELVKRVGVGSSNGEIVINGGFDSTANWTISGGTSNISGGTLKLIGDAGVGANVIQSKTTIAGRIYRYSLSIILNSGIAYLFFGSNLARIINPSHGTGLITGFFIPSTNNTFIKLVKDLSTATSMEFDNLSIVEYNQTEGAATAGGEIVFGNSVHYTLSIPKITPISYAGLLNSNSNGTVYHEPVIADAGVYDTGITVQSTNYPISEIEKIIKWENGVEYLLDVADAVIAIDGLSFTHQDLADGDLVMFTYAYNLESTVGKMTANFYDSRYVIADTANGKFYKHKIVSTNGVATIQLEEV